MTYPFTLNSEELAIFYKVIKTPILNNLTGEQWQAITSLISREVYDHHIEWCGHVHADGPEPEYPEPTRYER